MINIITANLAVIGAAFVGLQFHFILAYYNTWDYIMNKVGNAFGFFLLPFFIWVFTSGAVCLLIWKFPVDEEFKIITLWPGFIISLIIIYMLNIAFLLYPSP